MTPTVRKNLVLICLLVFLPTCLKRDGDSVTKQTAPHQGTVILQNDYSATYVVQKKFAQVFKDENLSRVDNTNSVPLGSVLTISRVTDNVYKFPTLNGMRYFLRSHLPTGSEQKPYLSSLGMNFSFEDVSGNNKPVYETPATIPQLIKQANKKGKKFIILYFWTLCNSETTCVEDTSSLVELQNGYPDAQVFSFYIDMPSGYTYKTKDQVQEAVKTYRTDRGISAMPFPVLWLAGRMDNVMPRVFSCLDANAQGSVPCAIFLDSCGVAHDVMPCLHTGELSQCTSTISGSKMDFNNPTFNANLTNVIATMRQCVY